MEAHRHAIEAGLECDLRVRTALVLMYANSGSVEDAHLVLDRMVDRNLITWNAMIGGLARHGRSDEAYSLFLQMPRERFVPNPTTYSSILNPNANLRTLEWLAEVSSHAKKAGFDSDVQAGTALVHTYSKTGSIDDARLVFDKMVQRMECNDWRTCTTWSWARSILPVSRDAERRSCSRCSNLS